MTTTSVQDVKRDILDRLSRLEARDFGPELLPADRQYRAKKLKIWRTSRPRARVAIAHARHHRPNPVVVGDLVIVSIFSPGRIRAFDRATGAERWHRRLPYHASDELCAAEGTLFGGTSKGLLALDPATGKVLWTYSPYGDEGESIYAAPVVADGRLFIGDRMGILHCLRADTGDLLWWSRPLLGPRNFINAAAAVCGDRVLVSAGRYASAHEVTTGKVIWRKPLDSHSQWELLPHRGCILVRTLQTLYAIDPATGYIADRWSFRGTNIGAVVVAGNILVVATSNCFGSGWKSDGSIPPGATSECRGIRDHETLWMQRYPLFSLVQLCWDPTEGVVYDATSAGLGILDPVSGRRVVCIHSFAVDRHDFPDHRTARPDVRDGTIYALAGDGAVWALRYPEEPED